VWIFSFHTILFKEDWGVCEEAFLFRLGKLNIRNQCKSMRINRESMLLRIFLLSFLLCLSTAVIAQERPVKIATLSSSLGSSRFPQSIGQSSVVIGTTTEAGPVMFQGFVQPLSLRVSPSREIIPELQWLAYPNPFHASLTLKFSQKFSSPASLELYSILGQKVWSGELPANQTQIQLVDFNRLPVGQYILRLLYSNQVLTKYLQKR
jgi:hypothetical protein